MRGLISRIFGFVAAVRFPRFLQTFINEKYVSGFKIDMSEFKEPKEYESLTALFTRELQRPRNFDVSPQAFISPSDGTCLERGVSKELKAISVKGHEYGIAELLGDIMAAYAGEVPANMLLAPAFKNLMEELVPSWRRVVAKATAEAAKKSGVSRI